MNKKISTKYLFNIITFIFTLTIGYIIFYYYELKIAVFVGIAILLLATIIEYKLLKIKERENSGVKVIIFIISLIIYIFIVNLIPLENNNEKSFIKFLLFADGYIVLTILLINYIFLYLFRIIVPNKWLINDEIEDTTNKINKNKNN